MRIGGKERGLKEVGDEGKRRKGWGKIVRCRDEKIREERGKEG